MDRVAGTLAGKIGDEQIRGGIRLFLMPVNAKQKVARPQRFQDVFGNWHVSPLPRSDL